MSYCRFSDGDVYMFNHVNGFIKCCACRLTKKKRYKISKDARQMIIEYNGDKRWYYWNYQDMSFHTLKEALSHLYEHKQAGHKVGRGAISRLRKEIKEYEIKSKFIGLKRNR